MHIDTLALEERITFMHIFGMRTSFLSLPHFQFSENDETEIIPEIESCRSEYMTIFVGCTYAYKGVLMVR